jgi:hypothetical protein
MKEIAMTPLQKGEILPQRRRDAEKFRGVAEKFAYVKG